MVPKTAIMHLYNKRSEKAKNKPSTYILSSSRIKKRASKISPIPKFVANAPIASIQAKNSSSISKNNSSLISDTKNDNSHGDAKYSTLEYQKKISNNRKSIQVNPKLSPWTLKKPEYLTKYHIKNQQSKITHTTASSNFKYTLNIPSKDNLSNSPVSFHNTKIPLKKVQKMSNKDLDFYKTTPSQLESTLNQSSAESLYETTVIPDTIKSHGALCEFWLMNPKHLGGKSMGSKWICHSTSPSRATMLNRFKNKIMHGKCDFLMQILYSSTLDRKASTSNAHNGIEAESIESSKRLYSSNENLDSKIIWKSSENNREKIREEAKIRANDYPHTERKVILDLYNSKHIIFIVFHRQRLRWGKAKFWHK